MTEHAEHAVTAVSDPHEGSLSGEPDDVFDDSAHQTDDQLGRKTDNRRTLWIWRVVTFVLPLLILVGAVVGVSAMSALSPKPEETEDAVKALPVLTEPARNGTTVLSVTTQGEVQPRTQINVVTEVSGRITYMSPNFIEGGRFERGELLARVDSTEYRLRVTQARASVSQARTVLAREQSEADQARRDWDELGRGGAPSALTLREPQLAEAAAMLASAQAQLDEAELRLSRTEIRAGFDGRVDQRFVDPGEFVGQNTRLGEIYATDIMDVRLPLTPTDMRQLGITLGFEADGSSGIPVTFTTDIAGDLNRWTGHITRTDSRYDAQSRVLYAYAEVQNPFNQVDPQTGDAMGPLAPGLFVKAEIAGQTLDNIIIIPRAALRGDDRVFIASDDGTLSIRPVVVRSSDRDRAILTSGVQAGEAVITSPIRGAANGMTIEIVDPSQTGAEG